MHLLSDLMKEKHVALKKNSRRQERMAEIENSWKSYTCFSAECLKKKKCHQYTSILADCSKQLVQQHGNFMDCSAFPSCKAQQVIRSWLTSASHGLRQK